MDMNQKKRAAQIVAWEAKQRDLKANEVGVNTIPKVEIDGAWYVVDIEIVRMAQQMM